MDRSRLRRSVSTDASEPLTIDDERRIAAEIVDALEAGDKDRHRAARDELIRRHMRLVVQIGRGYEHRLGADEILAVGSLALTEAFERWRPSSGSMSAYQWARRWVTTALTRAVDGERTIRIPEPTAYRAACRSRAVADKEGELGRTLTAAERDEVTGGGPMLSDLPAAYATPIRVATVNANPLVPAELPDRQPAPEEICMEAETVAHIRRALDELTPEERDVIATRFGLDGRERLTLAELGVRYGISGEGMRRIEASALAKLSHPAIKSGGIHA